MTYFPDDLKSFFFIRSFLDIWGRSDENHYYQKLKNIFDFYVDSRTICIIDFHFIEKLQEKFKGLNFFDEFIENKNLKTIILSSTSNPDELVKIKKLCQRNENYFFVQKEMNIKNNFVKKITELLNRN